MRGHAVNLSTPTLPFTGSTDATRIASQMAAELAGKSAQTMRGMVLACIRGQGPFDAAYGATDNEVIAMSGISGSTVRPRRIELLRAGLIVDSGQKRNGCTVWRTA